MAIFRYRAPARGNVMSDRPLPVPLLPGWLRWLAAGALAVFLFYVSIVTVPPETAVDTARPSLLQLDKWRHLLAYAALGGSLAYALADSDFGRRRQATAVFLVTVAYGVGIESGQSFLPKRYFSLGDAYANALGAVIAMTWYALRPYLTLVPVAALLDR